MRRTYLTVIFLMLLHSTTAWSAPSNAVTKEKKVVGETAVITVSDSAGKNNTYLSRIDTGARVTSIHALDINIDNAAAEAKANIGKALRFTTENAKGESSTLSATIVDVARIRNAQGVENRYVVELNLDWLGFNKTIQVNLRDRSAMSYKLLIGRNWMHGDIIVDVDKNEGIIK